MSLLEQSRDRLPERRQELPDGEKEVNKFISGHPKFLSEPMLSFSQHPPAANEIV
jgi:hypothetical protein